ncbi:amidohydrolase [Flavobacterium sp.]|uniref:amidohydrolase n=1 Tax=Flavobacterium sp. TaxID=239 RepID=UPI0039E4E94F
MKVALIQAPLVWENAEANRQYFSHKIEATEADLIVLPEMFSTGFTMEPQRVAEKMSGETVLWMQSTAMARQTALVGSLVIAENGHFYNRMLFVHPSGTIQQYDKRHLFTLAGENNVYAPGKEKLVVDYRGWKICPLVCYDLRFPVFSRNVENYDLLIYSANWPKPRTNAWDALLKARAIENMSYVIGLNRIGEDANGHQYIGHSQLIDGLGNFVITPSESEVVMMAELDLEHIREIRKKFPFLEDRDQFKVMPD